MKPPKFTETELKEHASQLAAMGMCCINSPSLWESSQPIIKYIEEHFEPSSSALASPMSAEQFYPIWAKAEMERTGKRVAWPSPADEYKFAEAYAASVRAASTGTGWIPVSERMPEYDTDVCLWASDWNKTYIGYWRHSEEWIGRHRPEENELPDGAPTHWQPLPAPPVASQKGKEEE